MANKIIIVLSLLLYSSYSFSFDCPVFNDEIVKERCLIFSAKEENLDSSQNQLCVVTVKRVELENPDLSCDSIISEVHLAEVKVGNVITDQWEFDTKTYGVSDPGPTNNPPIAAREFLNRDNISPVSGNFKIEVTYSLLSTDKGLVAFKNGTSDAGKQFFYTTQDNWGISN